MDHFPETVGVGVFDGSIKCDKTCLDFVEPGCRDTVMMLAEQFYAGKTVD